MNAKYYVLLSIGAILAILLYSCNHKSQENKEQSNKLPDENTVRSKEQFLSIGVLTYDEIPESANIDGCSCAYAHNEKEYKQEKYIYFDDFGFGTAIMKINNEIVVFQIKIEENINVNTEIITGKSSEYELYITKENIEATGYESSSCKGVLKLTNKKNNSVQKDFWGICGC